MVKSQVSTRGALGAALEARTGAKLAELGAVFGAGLLVMAVGLSLAGDNVLLGQGAIWLGNVTMLVIIWLGLRARGAGFGQFGLDFGFAGVRAILVTLVRAAAVFVAATAAFLVPAIVYGAIAGRPAQADMSGYDGLRGNLPLLLLTLAGVYVVSSFGEEVVYRGFLIRRLAELGGSGQLAWRGATLASAVLFGFAHYAWGPLGVVQTTAMGLALGYAYLRLGRRLWPLILAHGAMDTLLLVQMYLAAPGS